MSALCRDCALLTDGSPESCPRCGSHRMFAHPELAGLNIAHIDCDAFYAAVEKRDNPAIADQPVIVGHPGGRGVVTTACYIARRYGPRSAMPMFKALELCPQAVVIPPNMAKYKQVSWQIHELLVQATPMIEPVSLDEAYLDLSPGVRRVDRPAAVLLARLALAIERRIGITVSVGLSYNKFLAKFASDRDKPRGFAAVGQAEACALLAPLPVKAIHGIGQATAHRMAMAGIETVGQLQGMPEAELVGRWGKFGKWLALLVRGEDPRPVTPDRPAKSISAETTFDRDIADLAGLARALEGLCARVAARLGRTGLAGRTVVVKLKTADFRTLTRNRRLVHATCRADVMLRHGAALLAPEIDGRHFRLIGIGVADLCPLAEADPPDLFTRLA